MKSLLSQIKSPSDIKNFEIKDLKHLALDIRNKIIEVVSKNGGHLASSLGAVELCIALHYVFDVEKNDSIIWDVGHQAYAHKLLTGRAKHFHTLRQLGGLSGFPSRFESPYDPFLVGHGSTAISCALGIAASKKLLNQQGEIVAVVGDGSLQGGMALEALNNVAHLDRKIIVILNDNEMSISPTVGAISKYLNRVITNPIYNRIRDDIENLFRKIPHLGTPSLKAARKLEETLKNLLVPGIIFEELGFTYIGPIYGYHIGELVDILKGVRKLTQPVFIHVITKKGKGYKFAEQEPSRFHSANPFIIETGENKNKRIEDTFSNVFAQRLNYLAKKDEKIVTITAAMAGGTGLDKIACHFPDRCFDVGMAEQHAVTFAAGLANEGFIPVVAIYSTFLQRAYDQIMHDVCLQNLHVVFALDRSGLVGEDGPTHHGVFDIAYLRHLPHMTVMAPKSLDELESMLTLAINHKQGPVAIRYPKGSPLWKTKYTEERNIKFAKSEILKKGEKLVILALGSMVNPSMKAVKRLQQEGINPGVVNARFIKPLDEEMLDNLEKKYDYILPVEEGCLNGGFGSAVLEYFCLKRGNVKIKNLGIPDKFIKHGNREVLLEELGLCPDGIFETVKGLWQK